MHDEACVMDEAVHRESIKSVCTPPLHFTNLLIQCQVFDMRYGAFIVLCAFKTTIFE